MSMWTLRASGPINTGEVRRALELFTDPEGVCQVFGVPSYKHANRKGNDLDGLVDVVEQLKDNDCIYFVLNPLVSTLPILPEVRGGKRYKKGQVLYRRWLFLDIDPIKPPDYADDPATDAEHELTRQATQEIQVYLTEECGWPSPVIVDSGNGWYLLWRIYLQDSAHSQAIIRTWAKSLAPRIAGKAIVDGKVHDPPRLAKIPGTMACKGTSYPDRPYRPCRLVYVPSDLEIVTAEMIVSATVTPNTESKNHASATNGASSKSPFTLKASNAGGANAYVKKALENECLKVALAKPPPLGGDGRNNALNEAAFSLGTLVGANLLTRSEVESRLRDVARQCGLYDDSNCRERGVESTIESGLNAGIASPRELPDKPKLVSAASVNDPGPTTEEGETLTIGAHEIQPEAISWLWYGRLPKGKLVTWAGQTGLGKSFLSCDIAARLSQGAEIPFGGGERFPVGGTLLLNCEDGYADTLVPRLIEADANLRMIRFMKTDKLACWTMAHLDSLEKAIKETPDCRFVVLDAAPSFLGGIDDHKNSELRQIITPLALRIQDWDVSLVFVTHFNKAGSNKVEVLDRVMGGVAWVSGVRTAAAFIKAPVPEEPERRLFITLKSNISGKPPALAYRLANVDDDRSRCRVEWLEEIDTTAEEAMEMALRGGRPRKVVASEWLIERFTDKLEWPSDDLFAAAKQEGISRDAIFEAKAKLQLPRARRIVSADGDVKYHWWVPADWPHLPVKGEPDAGDDEGEFV